MTVVDGGGPISGPGYVRIKKMPVYKSVGELQAIARAEMIYTKNTSVRIRIFATESCADYPDYPVAGYLAGPGSPE